MREKDRARAYVKSSTNISIEYLYICNDGEFTTYTPYVNLCDKKHGDVL